MDLDAMTGVGRPRSRWLWIVVGILLPIVVIGGGAAFFIHTFIAPIAPFAFRFPEPTLFASNEPAVPATTASAPASAAAIQPPSQPAPSRPLPMMSGFSTASVWPGAAPAQPPAPAYPSADP